MRPTLLKFGGIGAYPKDVVVDFEHLSKKGLYLVVGPTGSGKTTIFDAMTYALYGKTASDREGMFVSDHDNRVDPYVELHFTHQGRFFIAHREPAKDKTKNPLPNKQWFREVDADGNVIRTETGSKAVSSEASELLGLDAEQFMQVVLLPQNKFQKFLVANSRDRKPLLQKIFGTGLYWRVAENLKQTAKRLEEEADKVERKISIAHGQAQMTLTDLHDQPYFADLDLTAPENNAIPDVIETLKAALSTIAIENLELVAKNKKAIEDKTRAEGEAGRFDAAQEKSELDKIQSESKVDFELAIKQLENNDRAQRVLKASKRADESSESARLARHRAQELRETLTKALSKLSIDSDATKTLLNSISSASAKTLATELSRVHKRVTDTRKAITERDELTTALKKIETDTKKLQTKIDANKRELDEASENLKKKKAEEKAAAAAEKKLPALEKKIDDLDELLELADVDNKTTALSKATGELQKAKKAFSDAETQLDKARQDRTRHLAGELAAALSAQEECPVCGSTEHPKKAKKTAESDIAALESKRDKAQGKKLAAETLVNDAQKALEDAQAAQKKLPSEAAQQALRDLYDDTFEKAERSDELSDEVEELSENIEGLKKIIRVDELEFRSKETEMKEKKDRIAVLTPDAESLGTPQTVDKANVILTSASQTLDEIEPADTAVAEEDAKSATANKQLKETLKTEKFASVEEAEKAQLSDVTVTDLELLIDEYQKRESRLLVLSGKIGEAPVPKLRPDVEELTQLVQLASDALDASTSSKNKTESAITTLDKVLQDLNQLGPESQVRVKQADEAKTLAKIVDLGVGSGEDRQLGLEEWVQRTLFEEVCLVATTQLQKLSNNRYFLTLEPEGAKMKKRAGGLELYVLDSHNGKTRSVQTLSGGEQFLTSLALALALAEVVERHAGGMELSTLFIDEGFGSLDTETLEQATSVLTKLQDIGRTVGLITHVELMQERLPIGIRIDKTSSGSTLALVD
jgi:exonuclease SbcC